jgi:hypothetical protein
MDWLPWIWPYEAYLDRVSEGRSAQRSPNTLGPTILDRSLIEVIYGTIAPESRCEKCGQRLGRRLRVVLPAEPSLVGDVRVVTRCRGWRGHRHVATVSCAGDGLQFGSLHLQASTPTQNVRKL